MPKAGRVRTGPRDSASIWFRGIVGLFGVLLASILLLSMGGTGGPVEGPGAEFLPESGSFAVESPPAPQPVAADPPALASPVPREVAERADAPWAAALRPLTDRYELEVDWQGQGFPHRAASGVEVNAGPASESDLAASATIFADAVERHYTPEFLGQTSLRRLVLVGRLTADRRPSRVVADRAGGALYLDVAAPDLAASFHKGMFRLIDESLAADPPEGLVAGDLAAPLWRAINEPTFRYADERPADEPATEAPAPVPGFVSEAALASLAEDRAETFAAMVNDPSALSARASSDPRLAAKVLQILEAIDLFSTGRPPWGSEEFASLRPSDAPGVKVRQRHDLPEFSDQPTELIARGFGDLPELEGESDFEEDGADPWPTFAEPLPTGSKQVDLVNGSGLELTLGLRDGDRGLDVRIPPREQRTVRLPIGTYQMYVRWADDSGITLQGQDLALNANVGRMSLTLKPTTGRSNLRRVRRLGR